MLAEFVTQHPEIAQDAERHLLPVEPTSPRRPRRERLRALLAELVKVLEHGDIEDHLGGQLGTDGDGDVRDRELLRNGILDKLEQDHFDATGRELAILSDWVWAAENDRLRASNRQRSVLLDLCPDAAGVVSLDGRVQYLNRAAEQLIHSRTGLVGGHMIGRSGQELGFVVEAGPLPAEWAQLARSNSVAEVLVFGHWHELRATEILGRDGTVQSLGFTLTDIHDRKLGLVRLELLSKLSRVVGMVERDDLWRSLAQIPIPQLADWCGISLVQGDHIESTFIAQSNPAKAALCDALVGAANTSKFHPLWRGLLTTGFQLLSEVSDDLLRGIMPSEEYYQLVAQVGIRSMMVVPIVSRGQPIAVLTLVYTEESGRRYGHDDPGLAVELALHAAHMAENARLVAEAKSSDARFRIALADARTIVYEQDKSLRYIWHYGPDVPYSLLGMTHEEALPPEEAAALTKLKQQVLDSGEPVKTEIELSFGGVKRCYREVIEPVVDRLGRSVGVTGAATDMTEEKRAQRLLKGAVELRDRVMGILGHDLRTPLTTMTMAATTLLGRDDVPADANRMLLMIERAAHRMTEMIGTLLDFTRVRFSGKPLPVDRKPCDLADVAQEIVEESRTALPDRTIELEVRGDTKWQCDAARIAQALANLVSNAASYGDPTRPIQISVDGLDEAIIIIIHNKGPAIPPWLLPVMFEPFSRGHVDVVSPHGLGLGLFVVKEIVASHGGSIDVESTNEAGTTFTIRFPRRS